MALSLRGYPRVASAGLASLVAVAALAVLPHGSPAGVLNWLSLGPQSWLSTSAGLHWLPVRDPAPAGMASPPASADRVALAIGRVVAAAPAELTPVAPLPVSGAPVTAPRGEVKAPKPIAQPPGDQPAGGPPVTSRPQAGGRPAETAPLTLTSAHTLAARGQEASPRG